MIRSPHFWVRGSQGNQRSQGELHYIRRYIASRVIGSWVCTVLYGDGVSSTVQTNTDAVTPLLHHVWETETELLFGSSSCRAVPNPTIRNGRGSVTWSRGMALVCLCSVFPHFQQLH
jgi:hypothetical protein